MRDEKRREGKGREGDMPSVFFASYVSALGVMLLKFLK
jgi:hypothetical protein